MFPHLCALRNKRVFSEMIDLIRKVGLTVRIVREQRVSVDTLGMTN